MSYVNEWVRSQRSSNLQNKILVILCWQSHKNPCCTTMKTLYEYCEWMGQKSLTNIDLKCTRSPSFLYVFYFDKFIYTFECTNDMRGWVNDTYELVNRIWIILNSNDPLTTIKNARNRILKKATCVFCDQTQKMNIEPGREHPNSRII